LYSSYSHIPIPNHSFCPILSPSLFHIDDNDLYACVYQKPSKRPELLHCSIPPHVHPSWRF